MPWSPTADEFTLLTYVRHHERCVSHTSTRNVCNCRLTEVLRILYERTGDERWNPSIAWSERILTPDQYRLRRIENPPPPIEQSHNRRGKPSEMSDG